MLNFITFLTKSFGINKASTIILAIPLTVWLAEKGQTVESYGLNKWAFGLLVFGFISDSCIGTWYAITNRGHGVKGTQFEWKKFLQILNKAVLLTFLVVLSYLAAEAGKNGFSVFNVNAGIGDDFILSLAAITEIKSALKKFQKLVNSPVLDLLLKVLTVFDEVIPSNKPLK